MTDDPICARCGCYRSAHGEDERCEPVGWTFTMSAASVDDEMVERVARALAKADGKDPDAPAWVKMPGNETFGICWRDQYADKAKAALAAVKLEGVGEPSHD